MCRKRAIHIISIFLPALQKGEHRNTCCEGKKGSGRDSWQLCVPGGDCPHHGAEVCDGFPAVPAGTGVEPGRGKIVPADDEQLDPAGSGGLAPASI